MKLCPSEDEAQLSATEVAVNHLEIVDADLGFAFGVSGMEMREAVIVEEHRDRDPEEAADSRHYFMMAGSAAPKQGLQPQARS